MTSEPPPDRSAEIRPEDVRPGPPPSVPATPAAPATGAGERVAWIVALAADVLQWVAFPLFAPGVLSPWDDGLDLLVALVLVRLLGWHWAFLPAFAAELVPGLDLVPTWTLAVLMATRARRGSGSRS